MSKKSELKKQIMDSEKEIEALEMKLMRSQTALLGAIVNDQEPLDTDKEYFRIYSKLIELERENLKRLRIELDKM